jgi:hypothetical protein
MDRVVGDRVVGDRVAGDRVVGDRVVGDRVVADRVVGDRVVSVIGQCVIASCRRPAVTHLVVDVGESRLLGSVCEHCDRATRSAAFLLELAA